MSASRTVAIFGIVALTLLVGAGVWFALSQNRMSPMVSASEIVDTTEGEVTVMAASLADGQILYYQTESYQANRPGPLGPDQYPQTVIYETWLKVGSDGRISESVTTMKSTGDDLLQYAVGTGATITQTDVASGSVFEFTLAPDTTKLNEWLRASAARPQRLLQEDEYECVGRGSMDGKASVIFEYEYEAGSPVEGVRVPAGRVRLEFVEADPLLNREIHYAESPAGTDQVLESVETVEYQVLPADSEMPTLP